MKLNFLRKADIDFEKWDYCIHNAVNGNVYGYSWYISSMANHWGALVLGDYKAVFPLVWDRKLFGFKRLYQPFFTQQHGLYSTDVITPDLLRTFLLEAGRQFPGISICLNEQNHPIDLPGFSFQARNNYLLPLHQTYDSIRSKYSKSLRKRLKRVASRYDWIDTPCTVSELVDLYRQYQGHKLPCTDEDFRRVKGMMQTAIDRGMGKIIGLKGPDETFEVAGFFLFSHGRIINLLGTSTDVGREHFAMHSLLDRLIRQHSETHQVLDFEGSSIPSIAYFFSSFGSKNSPYYFLEYNRLPFWVKGLSNTLRRGTASNRRP
ncbi:MAG: hypothetical protein DHS20C18_32520 [Saprospiraceae bacterium]|nr:MAG: hypothetical protein DHS20C18_32520 [Saprospiraceae bacterium]